MGASSSGWMWVSVKKTKSKWAGEDVLAGHAILGETVAAAVVRAADFRKVRRFRGIVDPWWKDFFVRRDSSIGVGLCVWRVGNQVSVWSRPVDVQNRGFRVGRRRRLSFCRRVNLKSGGGAPHSILILLRSRAVKAGWLEQDYNCLR